MPSAEIRFAFYFLSKPDTVHLSHGGIYIKGETHYFVDFDLGEDQMKVHAFAALFDINAPLIRKGLTLFFRIPLKSNVHLLA